MSFILIRSFVDPPPWPVPHLHRSFANANVRLSKKVLRNQARVYAVRGYGEYEASMGTGTDRAEDAISEMGNNKRQSYRPHSGRRLGVADGCTRHIKILKTRSRGLVLTMIIH